MDKFILLLTCHVDDLTVCTITRIVSEQFEIALRQYVEFTNCHKFDCFSILTQVRLYHVQTCDLGHLIYQTKRLSQRAPRLPPSCPDVLDTEMRLMRPAPFGLGEGLGQTIVYFKTQHFRYMAIVDSYHGYVPSVVLIFLMFHLIPHGHYLRFSSIASTYISGQAQMMSNYSSLCTPGRLTHLLSTMSFLCYW